MLKTLYESGYSFEYEFNHPDLAYREKSNEPDSSQIYK